MTPAPGEADRRCLDDPWVGRELKPTPGASAGAGSGPRTRRAGGPHHSSGWGGELALGPLEALPVFPRCQGDTWCWAPILGPVTPQPLVFFHKIPNAAADMSLCRIPDLVHKAASCPAGHHAGLCTDPAWPVLPGHVGCDSKPTAWERWFLFSMPRDSDTLG